MARRGVIVWASEIEPVGPPTCNACDKGMWWHGSTLGWGCPRHGGGRDCQATPAERHPKREAK